MPETVMREDMGQVLVDEPRRGRAYARSVKGSRRLAWNRIDPDGESAPSRLGMKRGSLRSKHSGEHLGPLYRYLRQQANRPWDKVYGELCAGLDRRNVVQDHLFQHIGDRVALETVLVDGEVHARTWGRTQPLAETRYAMYVHPRTKLLLVNRAREKAARRRNEERAARSRRPSESRRVISPDRQWHRIDGLWFEVALRELVGDELVYDTVLKRTVSTLSSAVLCKAYGYSDMYAASKRQLDGRTIARHGLV
jgi:hypothetical protein